MKSSSVSAVADRAAPPTGRSLQAVSGGAGIPNADALSLLRAPFPAHQISKLPKPYKKDSPKGKCNECGGYHGLPAVHLDYVGHAALTDRLLDADPHWNWEPMGRNPDGTPALDANGGLWIELTVCGVTRPGYGCADGKRGGDAMKEIIGDALRNAAMRFGAALDLWHKGDLHADDDMPGYVPPTPIAGETVVTDYVFPEGPATGITQLKTMARSLWREIEGCGDDSELDALLGVEEHKALMKQMAALENPAHRAIWEGDGGDNPGISGLIIRKQHEFAYALGPNILQAG